MKSNLVLFLTGYLFTCGFEIMIFLSGFVFGNTYGNIKEGGK